jgi:hypothetical protein
MAAVVASKKAAQRMIRKMEKKKQEEKERRKRWLGKGTLWGRAAARKAREEEILKEEKKMQAARAVRGGVRTINVSNVGKKYKRVEDGTVVKVRKKKWRIRLCCCGKQWTVENRNSLEGSDDELEEFSKFEIAGHNWKKKQAEKAAYKAANARK